MASCPLTALMFNQSKRVLPLYCWHPLIWPLFSICLLLFTFFPIYSPTCQLALLASVTHSSSIQKQQLRTHDLIRSVSDPIASSNTSAPPIFPSFIKTHHHLLLRRTDVSDLSCFHGGRAVMNLQSMSFVTEEAKCHQMSVVPKELTSTCPGTI